MDFQPTQQQLAIIEHFRNALFYRSSSVSSMFVSAVAGSGKSSTIMLLVDELKQLESTLGRRFNACSVSFNTNIRDAIGKKLRTIDSRVEALTTNQLGRRILSTSAKQRLCKDPQKLADDRKYRTIVENRMRSYSYSREYFSKPRDYVKCISAICTLIDAVRALQVEPSDLNLIEIIFHYDLSEKIDIEAPWWPLVSSQVGLAIEQGIADYKATGIHDFNDQITLPLYLDLAAPIWDVIFVDEAQDLNRARLDMITRSIKSGGVLVFVGDPRQAIQGFTFADTDSVSTIIQTTNAVEFPLSVCWRCDADIVRLAQDVVSYIEPRPGADTGTVDIVEESLLVDRLQPGDLVLCRVNASLARYCMQCMRAGKAAVVRGREIGKSVGALLDDIPSISSFEDLGDAIDTYIYQKINGLFGRDDSEKKAADWEDKGDTLRAFLDGYIFNLRSTCDGSIEGFKVFINEKFSDADVKSAIVFSTIHKAKGLEYDRVFILEPGLLPHPAAKSGWQVRQEYNVVYVAVTRARYSLYFVGNVPTCLKNRYNELKGLVDDALVIESDEPTQLSLDSVSSLGVNETGLSQEVSEPEISGSVEISDQAPADVLELSNDEPSLLPQLDHNGELSDAYIERVLAPVRRSNAGRKRKENLERVNVKLSLDQIELTEPMDRSRLLRVLLDTYLGQGDLAGLLTVDQREAIDREYIKK